MAKICLDPGHGGSHPGACGNGLRECDISLEVAMKTHDYLVAAGVQVIMTRETDIDVAYPNASATAELQARCDVSDNAGADLFMSIHCNAVDNLTAKGTESFYFSGSLKGRQFAAFVQMQLVGTLGTVNRGLKTNSLYVTGHTQAVAVLVELAFLSNSEDAALLGDPTTQDEIAKALARGVTDYLAE